LKHVAVAIPASEHCAKGPRLLSPAGARIGTVYSGINFDIFAAGGLKDKTAMRTSFGLPEDRFIVMAVGALKMRKGHDQLFEALLEMNPLERPRVFVVLCGMGDVSDMEEKADDTFNIGAQEFTTMREDYQAVLDRAGFGKKIVGLPAAPAIWTLRVLEFLHISPLYKWVYETASKDSFVSIEKAQRVLGYAPQYSNKQALVRNYEWYLAHRAEFEGASGISHRVPWKQGILGIAKLFF
jgi:hypothetical protein